MQLSVIIPVYNCARYIDRCIESVLTQSFREIEVILVDDGSTDNSGDICEEWAKKDNRIKVIHQANGGLSAARNTGIRHSTSPYITFVDADDEIAEETLLPNMDLLSKNTYIDLLEYPIDVHYGAPDFYSIQFNTTIVKDNIFRNWINTGGYRHCYACNKIYKKELHNNIEFPSGESFEDAAICPELIKSSGAVCYSEYGRYRYYSNGEGITRKYTFANQEPLFRHNCSLLSYSIKKEYKESITQLWIVCLNLLIDLRRCGNTDKRYIQSATSYISANRPSIWSLHKSGLSLKDKVKFITSAVLGTALLTSLFTKNRPL
ncbi:MAG: glycosyltransferase family 2 protein [Bacteroidaceae bacterium]|nr:glycosyltransferase family 2 protein [Bacteroidaceae bacterium]